MSDKFEEARKVLGADKNEILLYCPDCKNAG